MGPPNPSQDPGAPVPMRRCAAGSPPLSGRLASAWLPERRVPHALGEGLSHYIIVRSFAGASICGPEGPTAQLAPTAQGAYSSPTARNMRIANLALGAPTARLCALQTAVPGCPLLAHRDLESLILGPKAPTARPRCMQTWLWRRPLLGSVRCELRSQGAHWLHIAGCNL